eukprot:NODE_9214_length_1439_cov_7.148628.p1 GENE.NODE_9214_length_1439_cov_7.148628~~NODE_9214_length_1439_cov_7.148628.p1  ORF type:complete len:306 (+),score=50.79 NODE_9214_length_1439_cov_7.148628:120-920(+)
MDRLKVLMQVGASSSSSSSSVVTCCRSIYREGGWSGFYRGNGVNVLKIVPESASKFLAYDWLRHVVARNPGDMQVHERFVAGGAAGMVSQALIYPLEIAKTRLAVAPRNAYSGIADCIMQTLRMEGPRALYRGLGTSCAGIIPYSGIDLACFMTLKDRWQRAHPENREGPGAITLLSMGASSTALGQAVTYPMQLLRTRLQAQGMPGREVVHSSPFSLLRCIVRESGIRGLYRGIGPNFMKAMPAISISYVVYEKTSRCMIGMVGL